MRNFSDKNCRENQNNILCSITLLFRNIVPLMTQCKKCCKSAYDNILGHMRFACWVTKATDTHSEYVTLIAFPRQKWLHKRASVLCYVYTVCLVIYLHPSDLGSHSRNATTA